MWKWFRWVLLTVLVFVIGVVIYTTFLSNGPLPFSDNSRIVKSFTPNSKAAFQYNPPTIINDFIYVGTSSRLAPDGDAAKNLEDSPANYFYKMDLNLKPIWTYSLGGKLQVDGGAALDSRGNIYFPVLDFAVAKPEVTKETKNYSTSLYLYSLTSTGQLRWKKQISANDESWIHAMINCAIDQNDNVYVGGKKLFSFDPDGNLRWLYPQDNGEISGMRSSPIIDKEGNIYFISPAPSQNDEKDNIYAYKFNGSGNLLWSALLENNILDPEGGTDNGGGGKENMILSSPAFGLNEKTLVTTAGNTINSVDTVTGKINWSIKPEGATGSFKASPAIDDKNNIYVGSKSNNEAKFYAIKADGSGLLWKNTEIASDMYSSPLLGSDGKVYVGSEYSDLKEFHALDMKTGQQVWGVNLPDSSFGSPALYKGYLYFGIFQYKLGSDTFFKIKADANDYLPGAPWPRFHGGNSNTGRSN